MRWNWSFRSDRAQAGVRGRGLRVAFSCGYLVESIVWIMSVVSTGVTEMELVF